jgi:hypothetical protein
MRTALILAASGLFVGTSLIATAPGQVRPGEMTRAEVWVQNESIPVDLRHANLDSPLRVFVVNGGTSGTPPVPVTVVPKTWEYRSVIVAAGADAAAALGTLGTQGWEATGVALPAPNGGAQLLMKRPR